MLQNQIPEDALVPPKLTSGTALAPRGKLVFTTGILGTFSKYGGEGRGVKERNDGSFCPLLDALKEQCEVCSA